MPRQVAREFPQPLPPLAVFALRIPLRPVVQRHREVNQRLQEEPLRPRRAHPFGLPRLMRLEVSPLGKIRKPLFERRLHTRIIVG